MNAMGVLRARVVVVGVLSLLLGTPAACGGSSTSEPEAPSACLMRAQFGEPSASLYVLPYPPGDTYAVLQAYCDSRNSHHDQLAYDFHMRVGNPVTAARRGVVRQVVDEYPDEDKVDSHFNMVMIEHPDGTVAFYAHLQLGSITVSVGDEIRRGEQFALSGASGTPIPDLHFGVYSQWPVTGADLAINFRNADGPLDERGGLIAGEPYTALPW